MTMTWGVVQRLYDDEPPLLIWREERGTELADLSTQTGIPLDRLSLLDNDLRTATDAEVDRLANALRIPFEFLMMPHSTEAE